MRTSRLDYDVTGKPPLDYATARNANVAVPAYGDLQNPSLAASRNHRKPSTTGHRAA